MASLQLTRDPEHLLRQLDEEIQAAYFRKDFKNHERLGKAKERLVRSMRQRQRQRATHGHETLDH